MWIYIPGGYNLFMANTLEKLGQCHFNTRPALSRYYTWCHVNDTCSCTPHIGHNMFISQTELLYKAHQHQERIPERCFKTDLSQHQK